MVLKFSMKVTILLINLNDSIWKERRNSNITICVKIIKFVNTACKIEGKFFPELQYHVCTVSCPLISFECAVAIKKQQHRNQITSVVINCNHPNEISKIDNCHVFVTKLVAICL